MKIRLALMMLVLSCSVAAYAGSVDFETPGAPCMFGNATPLTSAYSSVGVNFAGGNGAILNNCANFGVNAHSGSYFLAFNASAQNLDSSIPTTPEVITFDNSVSNVSIWVASGNDGSYSLSDNNGVVSNFSGVPGGFWVQLSLNDANISSVTLNGPRIFVADDLSWSGDATRVDPSTQSAVPEPSSLVLLGSGLLSFAGVIRRKIRG
jgi:hypothetical protein